MAALDALFDFSKCGKPTRNDELALNFTLCGNWHAMQKASLHDRDGLVYPRVGTAVCLLRLVDHLSCRLAVSRSLYRRLMFVYCMWSFYFFYILVARNVLLLR